MKTAEEKLKAHSGHFYEVVKPLTSALRVHMSYFWMLILLYESLKVRPCTRACLASLPDRLPLLCIVGVSRRLRLLP